VSRIPVSFQTAFKIPRNSKKEPNNRKMNGPLVSICLPNLNTIPYLPERFETIFQQSYQNWELLVYDGYSEDGAWDYICKVAAGEPRMRPWQGPREGTPGSWSPCIRRARGNYVYIATSDDTMAPNCLEKLVTALEQHPDCDLAHCLLKTIDANGNDRPDPWSQHSTFARSSGRLLYQTHIRRAPFDGLLHLSGQTVYLSITQLMIRRSLFERIGDFSARWGSVGDFHWGMRAGLVANTIHVPDTWGGFRVHSNQATAAVRVYSQDHYCNIEEMVEDAINTCGGFLPPKLVSGLRSYWLSWTKDMRTYYNALHCRRLLQRRLYQCGQLFAGTKAARHEIVRRLSGKPTWGDEESNQLRWWLESLGLGPVLELVPAQKPARIGAGENP
jgi:glycosyltransferase involved in cell wall biosynthesis